MSFSTVISQVVMQGTGGVLIGTLTESVLPLPAVFVNSQNFIQTSGEVGLQLAVNGLAISGWNDFMVKRGFRGEDPTRGIPFIIGLLATQPGLLQKITNTSKYLIQAARVLMNAPAAPVLPPVLTPNTNNYCPPPGSADNNKKYGTDGVDEAAPKINHTPWV
jgi:hypothetical protein